MASTFPFRPAARAIAVAFAACALLSACGFHLRDALLLPAGVETVRIDSSQPDGALEQQLAQALVRAGAKIPAEDDPDVPGAPGAATLHIASERLADTAISVDQYGRSQEYTLRYAVVFDLRTADDSELVPQQAIELSRDYVSVPTRSAGTDSERDILVRELQREMVSSILRRIDAVSRLQQAQGAAMPASATAPAAEPAPAPAP
jgi:LPS-assembly lipoprotein